MTFGDCIIERLGLEFKKRNSHRLLFIVIMAMGLILLVYGVFAFSFGFHNMDQAQNLMRISQEHNISLLETGIGGAVIRLPDMYIAGTRMVVGSLFYIIAGVSLVWIAFLKK